MQLICHESETCVRSAPIYCSTKALHASQSKCVCRSLFAAYLEWQDTSFLLSYFNVYMVDSGARSTF